MTFKIRRLVRAIAAIAIGAAFVTAMPMRASAVTCNSVVGIDLGDPIPSPVTSCATDTDCAGLTSAICCTDAHVAVADCTAADVGICVHPFALPGDVIRVGLRMGASASVGATSVNVNRIRFDLDCNASQTLGLPCGDQGLVVQYEGDNTITSDCLTTWSTLGMNAVAARPLVTPLTACASDSACSAFQFTSCCTAALAGSGGCDTANVGFCVGNEVVFSATPAFSMAIPASGSTFTCQLAFDVKVLSAEPGSGTGADATPTLIEEVAGFKAAPGGLGPASDAFCLPESNNLPTNAAQTAQIPACPVCEDNNACTTNTCNTVTGACTFPAIPCNDNNACTNDTCDPATGCVSTAISCNDNNACTTDTCDPATGCVNTAISCNDNNACTSDTCNPSTGCANTPITCSDNDACVRTTCDPATGCVSTPGPPCDDNNACTSDTCNPATGCVSTPINCNDNNACTSDTCNPSTGCTNTPVNCNDNNACTSDTCNPATGCTSTPITTCDDNNACTNDTCNPATGCVSTPVAPCDDNNSCTNDTCNPATGCVSTDNGTCGGPCPGNPLVGAAGTLRVLALGGNEFTMSGPKTFVGGDVGIGATASGKFDAGTVTGNIIVDPNGILEKVNVPNAGVITKDLTQAVQDARNAATSAAALTPTQTFASDVVDSLTLVGNGGNNVVNFNNKLTLSTDTLTLKGGPTDVFILNVLGQFKFDGGSKVVLQGGVLPQNVLFNIVGPGDAVKISGGLGEDGIPKTQLIGTVLAPQRTISFTGSMITGALIGGMDIHMDSGSRLICPT